MIPCYICGKDAGTSWIIGYPPAPDSQKMGLCRAHNTPENRQTVQLAWQNYMLEQLGGLNQHEAYRLGDQTKLLSIYFIGGASLSIPCTEFSVTPNNTLKIITPGHEVVFFPLGQVRNYALTPVSPDSPPAELIHSGEMEALPETLEYTDLPITQPVTPINSKDGEENPAPEAEKPAFIENSSASASNDTSTDDSTKHMEDKNTE